MSDLDDSNPTPPEGEEPEQPETDQPDNFIVDILSGQKESVSAKKLLVQKVLRTLVQSYGFDRADLEINYNPAIQGHARKRVDIAVFRPGTEHTNANLNRIIVCRVQKKRDKLRSITEADADLKELKELMELIPETTLGMWTNGQEEFFFQAERGRFETVFRPLGVWPVPGEHTSDLDRTGGVIQISADAEGLEDALLRCWRYLNRNLGLDHKDSFKQLAVLMLAKMYDESRPGPERRFWIRGDEPFTENGQRDIQGRIEQCIRDAKTWQPNLLTRGWDLTLVPAETARVVTELARFSFSETKPRYRTGAFRSIARSVMDGSEGRYPTPLNVAELAVQMLDPQPADKILDCSSGTGTFLAMAGCHIFRRHLAELGTTPEEALPDHLLRAQTVTSEWASSSVLGCDIDPFLVVTTRMNLLFTAGHPGSVFRLDARTFPDGELDGVDLGRLAMPLASIDTVFVNPWFSTQDPVTDTSILSRYELGNVWEADEEGGYRNTGNINVGGVPPEVLFLERALQWVKPGTGRVAILLPDGLLGNPGDEYVRWWILRNCEVLASVDLPIEPFKATVKEYGLAPALASLLLLRRRSREELVRTDHPPYQVFMAVVGRAGVDSRGKLLFKRSPDGEELIFEEEVIERIREGNEIRIRRSQRRGRQLHDDLPLVAEKYISFCQSREVSHG